LGNINEDIKDLLRKYKITHSELLRYLDNLSHVQRVSEELSKPLSEERKKVYLLAIKKIKEEKRKLYED
jgi:exopolyphosphatase/pppGpp-phosphohydrolase